MSDEERIFVQEMCAPGSLGVMLGAMLRAVGEWVPEIGGRVSEGAGMREGRAVVVKTVEAWTAQVQEGMEQIRVKNGGVDPSSLKEGFDIDREAFCRVIEGMYALAENGLVGMPDAELQRLADLKPVAQIMELP
ncbi:hypothetical protein [Streptomyces sp. NPDC057002]|uniref:hypothetical protein n=1 Tax=Streptomyces sp. NPDC057002 TaxID=3345992 RepID=UPI003634900E